MKMRGIQILSVALVLFLGQGLAVPVGLSSLETRGKPGCAGSGNSGDKGEKGFESPPPCFWGRDASGKPDERG